MGRRQFKQAEAHLDNAMSLGMDEPAVHRALASLYSLTGRRPQAEKMLRRALAIDPDDPSTLTALGNHVLADGDLRSAGQYALSALQIDPQNADGLTLMGQVHLRRGEIDMAHEHALQALRIDARHEGALYLLAGLKARKSPFLGLWWRYSVWMEALGTSRSILVLIAAYAVYRIVGAVAQQQGFAVLAGPIQITWLAIVVYTWVGPALFRKSLEKELKPVALDAKF
jgi:Flp pilus assembly protein TadD